MKICHLTSAHPRYDTRIFLKECISFAENGDNVYLVVADGKGNEEKNGVAILDAGASRGRLDRIGRAPWRVLAKALEVDADIYHMHDPELLPIGLAIKRRGKKVIFDAHEDVPRQILSKHWIAAPMRPVISAVYEQFENFVVKRLAGVVAATPHIAQRFKQVNVNTVDVNNYPFPDELAPAAVPMARKKQVCYVGAISRIRGVRALVEALFLVPDVRLVLCGKFSESDFEDELRALPGWSQVDYLGQVARAELQIVMSESIGGVVTFLPLPNHIDAQPNKMFEYMSAGLPVIASDFPLWRQIISDADAGLCVDPSSPLVIASAIRRLIDDPGLVERLGSCGRAAVLTRYNWPPEAGKLIQFYRIVS